MMKRELCVGIIDTMINIESSCFDGRKIRVNYMNEKQIEVKDNWGHGTAVASSILQQNKEVSVELFPLFSLKEQVEIDHIISTLEYIYYNKSEEIIERVCERLFDLDIQKAEERAKLGYEYHMSNSGNKYSDWSSCTSAFMLTKRLRKWDEANRR